MNPWALVYDSFVPEQEGLREALCTLGNGYFATCGAAAESSADEVHYPGTYLAGGYNRLQTTIAGRTVENEDLVNLPNWLPLTFRVDGGEWFNLMAAAARACCCCTVSSSKMPGERSAGAPDVRWPSIRTAFP